MNRVSKGLFIAAASLAMTGTAFAQDPADPPEGGEVGGEAGGEVGGEAGGEAEVTPEVAPAAQVAPGVYTKETWPLAAIDRPLNAAKGMLEIKPALSMEYTGGDDATMTESETAFSLGVGGRYGISDKLEALFSFNRIILSPSPESGGDRIKGELALGAGLQLTRGAAGGKLDTEVKAALLYDLLFETAVIAAGVDARYKITDKLYVGTPINRPGLVVTVKGLEFPDGTGGTVTIAPIFLNIPVAVGFQATPKLQLQANMNLMRLNLNEDAKGGPDGSTATFIFGDYINLDIDALFALSHKMDVAVNLDLGELKDSAGDSFGLTAGVNIRL
jgi:hypothetical protein